MASPRTEKLHDLWVNCSGSARKPTSSRDIALRHEDLNESRENDMIVERDEPYPPQMPGGYVSPSPGHRHTIGIFSC